MIAATSFMLGIVATGLRSVIAYVLVSFLILVAFALAALTPGGAIGIAHLLLSILCFNAGIAAIVTVTLAGSYFRKAVHSR